VSLLDLSYLDEVLTQEEAAAILREQLPSRHGREEVLSRGYPGYDTSVGWFQYEDNQVKALVREAMGQGFRAFKLKVGWHDRERDLRRASMLRELAGLDALLIMLDANQQWTLPAALRPASRCARFHRISSRSQPTRMISRRIGLWLRQSRPIPIALGEHVPNRVMFKNFMQAGAVNLVQVDCTRVAGISEFLTISLLARKFGLPVPHVGDMGQIHQHLVLFNHIALGTTRYFWNASLTCDSTLSLRLGLRTERT
jgi:L-fuconate dehydratase